MLHTLTYKRIATEAKDGHNGLLYFHTWHGGFQELIFDTHANAGSFLTTMNTAHLLYHTKNKTKDETI